MSCQIVVRLHNFWHHNRLWLWLSHYFCNSCFWCTCLRELSELARLNLGDREFMRLILVEGILLLVGFVSAPALWGLWIVELGRLYRQKGQVAEQILPLLISLSSFMRLLNRLKGLLLQEISLSLRCHLFLGFFYYPLPSLIWVVPFKRRAIRAHLKLLNFGLAADPLCAFSVDVSEEPFFVICAKSGSFGFTLLFRFYLLLSRSLLFGTCLLFN